jgi:lipopolysaccharide/colanic/teichoic acid biosynthesis glycosyltransferase
MTSFDGSDTTTSEKERRSNASEGAPLAHEPEPPTLKITPERPLKVVDNDVARHDTEPEPEASGLSLHPTTAARFGDFAAAMTGPACAAIFAGSVAVFIGAALLVLLVRSQGRRSGLSEGEVSGISPVAAGIGAFALAIAASPEAGIAAAAQAGLIGLTAGALAAIVSRAIIGRFVHVRIAVLGEASVAHKLAWQLSDAGVRGFTIVGYVTRTTERDNLRDLEHISFKIRRLGLLSDLSHVVARNDVDLLVMSDNEDRMKVFERAAVCSERFRTQLLSLTAFEESVFRRVPLEELNVAWFQHIMHPSFRRIPYFLTRTIDIAFALVAGLVTMPIWVPVAVFMRLAFGTPVIVQRRRVGERGKAIALWRFRVARRQVTGEPPSEDARPVGFGKFLRRTRIERLPTLANLLRGDITLVGPRAARPEQMSELDGEIPFYARRNLIKPGILGWAQLHTAPAPGRTAADPEAELSNDLFYLKNQSVMLYAYVVLASLWFPISSQRRWS